MYYFKGSCKIEGKQCSAKRNLCILKTILFHWLLSHLKFTISMGTIGTSVEGRRERDFLWLFILSIYFSCSS